MPFTKYHGREELLDLRDQIRPRVSDRTDTMSGSTPRNYGSAVMTPFVRSRLARTNGDMEYAPKKEYLQSMSNHNNQE